MILGVQPYLNVGEVEGQVHLMPWEVLSNESFVVSVSCFMQTACKNSPSRVNLCSRNMIILITVALRSGCTTIHFMNPLSVDLNVGSMFLLL